MASGFAQDMQGNISKTQPQPQVKQFPSNPLSPNTKPAKDYTKWRLGMDVGVGNYYNANVYNVAFDESGNFGPSSVESYPLHLNVQLSGIYYFSKHFGIGLKYDFTTFGKTNSPQTNKYHFAIISPTLSYRYTTSNMKHTLYANLSAGFVTSFGPLHGYINGFENLNVNLDLGYDYHINDKFSIGARIYHGVQLNGVSFDCTGNRIGSSISLGYRF